MCLEKLKTKIRSDNMKKVISVIMALVMILSISVVAFAEDQTYTAYDDYGNAFTVRKDEVLGIVYDADGNIVSAMQTRTQYIAGLEHVIPAGGTFVTYSYTPKNSISFGFYFNYQNTYFTDPGHSLTINVRNAASASGPKYQIYEHVFSTTQADNIGDYCYITSNYGPCIEVCFDDLSSSRPFYQAVYTNDDDSSVTVSVLLNMD